MAPTDPAPVVLRRRDTEGNQLALMRWGLIPHWATDAKVGATFNARSETIARAPAFRDAWQWRMRCLVPAAGFYEWKKDGAEKQPFFIRMRGGEPMAFAGLWAINRHVGDQPVESYTIATTQPNELAAELHNRMPVIIGAEDFDRWLDPEVPPNEAARLLVPCPSDWLEAFPVSKEVGNVRNDGPQLMLPLNSQ